MASKNELEFGKRRIRMTDLAIFKHIRSNVERLLKHIEFSLYLL